MALSRGKVPQLREFIGRWGRALLPPEFAATNIDVVVVIPHSILHDLPIHMVEDIASQGPVGARIGFTYSSSRSLFVRCASRNPARRVGASPRTIDAGGVDVLTDHADDFRKICHELCEFFPENGRKMHDGPYTRMTLKQIIASLFRTLLYDDKPAADVLCVLAHGYIDPANHRMSGLLLGRVDRVLIRPIPIYGERALILRDLALRRSPEGPSTICRAEVFTAAELEIDTLINAHLVGLLACSAGWGRVLQGDEPASLGETFLQMGASSVIAPMWDCDIRAVREWASHFFTAWVQLQMPKALAFRHAIQLMSSGPFADNPERRGVMALRGDWL
jgi:hypothetical protein